VPPQRSARDHRARPCARAAARGRRGSIACGDRNGAGAGERNSARLRRRISDAVVRTIRGGGGGARCASLISVYARRPRPFARGAAAIRAGERPSAGLVDGGLQRRRAADRTVKAWIPVDEAGARSAARAADAAVETGTTLGPLHGVPIGVKDIIDVAGLPTTAGAREFAHTRPTRDATCVARLRAAGAVVLGKTHTTQFAYRDPAPTTNPWNAAHTPGGSSSGSAAAVAAREVPVALGSQTVGSILRPAAYNGVVGLKGTNGLVPLEGVVPRGSSLDHIGPLARSVEDAALILAVMAGRPLTPEPIETPRLAVARELFARADGELGRHLEAVIERLAKAGARVEEVRLPGCFAGLADAAAPP